jgi:hypothetical protein
MGIISKILFKFMGLIYMIKDEFCLNSRRWIKFMAYKGKPPTICPHREDNFVECKNCSYYEEREITYYKKYTEEKIWKKFI